MKPSTKRLLDRGDFHEFGATIGFDALRVAMGKQPRNHDVETICRWLRHVSAHTSGTASDRPATAE